VNPLWSYVLGAVGLTGLWLSGRKIWWSWYVNLGAQALWLAYSIGTRQYGFLIATFGYIYVFGTNAVLWTREYRATTSEKAARPTPDPVMVELDPGKILFVNVYTNGGGSVEVPVYYLINLWKEKHGAGSESEEVGTLGEAQGEPEQAQG
jgi:hypothetical protein